jgi:hypothetical protein
MRLHPTIALYLCLLGCGEKSPSDGGGGDSGGSGMADCAVSIDATFPEDGATDHYYLDPVRFVLSEPDGSAEVVTDVPGTTTTEDGGTTIVFTPDEPLAPSSVVVVPGTSVTTSAEPSGSESTKRTGSR